MNPTTAAALNSVDYFVLFIFALSMLAGYIRGFMKEVVSVVSVIAAFVLSTLFADKLAAVFSSSGSAVVQNAVSSVGVSGTSMDMPISMISLAMSYSAIFIATLFAGYLVGTLVTGLAQGAGESLTNRFLGVLFGGVRGLVVVIVLMFVAELTPMGSQPAWSQSQFVKSFQPMVTALDKLVHPGLDKIRAKAESAVQSVTGSVPDVSGTVSNLLNGNGSGQ